MSFITLISLPALHYFWPYWAYDYYIRAGIISSIEQSSQAHAGSRARAAKAAPKSAAFPAPTYDFGRRHRRLGLRFAGTA